MTVRLERLNVFGFTGFISGKVQRQSYFLRHLAKRKRPPEPAVSGFLCSFEGFVHSTLDRRPRLKRRTGSLKLDDLAPLAPAGVLPWPLSGVDLVKVVMRSGGAGVSSWLNAKEWMFMAPCGVEGELVRRGSACIFLQELRGRR